MMRFLRNEVGASPLLGIMVALIVFTASFGYVVFVAVEDGNQARANPQAGLDGAAASLAGLIIQPGVGWYPATACSGDPPELNEDAMHPDEVADGRFGLGRENCEDPTSSLGDANQVDYDKIRNLYNAFIKADGTNDRVDYEEARRSLGLTDAAQDFHLRSWPVLASVRQILRDGIKDPYLKPLYIGDYVEGTGEPPSRPVISHSGTVVQDDDFATLTVTIENTGADTIQAPFQVSLTARLSNGAITATQNTFDIPTGSSDSVDLKLRKTKDWAWEDPAVKKVEYTISDDVGPLASGEIDMSTIDMASPGNNQNNVVAVLNMDRLRYVEPFSGSNKWPKAYYAGYNGEGETINNFDGNDVDLKVVEISPGAYTNTFTDPAKNGQSLEDTAPEPDEPAAGKYRVELWVSDTSGSVHNDDVFEVLGGGVAECNVEAGDYVPGAPVVPEAGYVDSLFELFDKNVHSAKYHDSTMPYDPDVAGDVMPDIKCAMNYDLPNFLLDADGNPTMDMYTTLIVGSNVDHDAMTSASAKETIRDWVFAGGTLIVFGSDQQSVQWLQPIFHSSLETAGGGISNPDTTHPVLNKPNSLDYDSYQYTTEWTYNAHHDEKFTHVLPTDSGDVLAVGDPGDFGDGKVILTSWRPYDLTDDQAGECAELDPDTTCQSLFLLHNLVTLSYRELYMDFGPALPVERPHGSAVRLANVDHPELGQRVTMQFFVYVF